jgi:hypothetical protein
MPSPTDYRYKIENYGSNYQNTKFRFDEMQGDIDALNSNEKVENHYEELEILKELNTIHLLGYVKFKTNTSKTTCMNFLKRIFDDKTYTIKLIKSTRKEKDEFIEKVINKRRKMTYDIIKFLDENDDILKIIFEYLIPNYEIYRYENKIIQITTDRYNKRFFPQIDYRFNPNLLQLTSSKIPSSIQQYIKNLNPFEIYQIKYWSLELTHIQAYYEDNYNEYFKYIYHTKNIIIPNNTEEKRIFQKFYPDYKFDTYYNSETSIDSSIDVIVNAALIKAIKNVATGKLQYFYINKCKNLNTREDLKYIPPKIVEEGNNPIEYDFDVMPEMVLINAKRIA